MTNEEAIAVLENLLKEITKDFDVLEDKEKEAFAMAISALEKKQQKPAYEQFKPCLCGCNRRRTWYGTGSVGLVCHKCGLTVRGKNEVDAKREWNKYVTEHTKEETV